jgi:hypothetical protein
MFYKPIISYFDFNKKFDFIFTEYFSIITIDQKKKKT